MRGADGNPRLDRVAGSKQAGKPKLAYDTEQRKFYTVGEEEIVAADVLSKRVYQLTERTREKLQNLVDVREQLRQMRDALEAVGSRVGGQKIDDSLRSVRDPITRSSEVLGELATSAGIQKWADDVLVKQDGKSVANIDMVFGDLIRRGERGEFDQIWRIEFDDGTPPLYLTVEAKGAAGKRGTKIIDGVKYEQGTPEYHRAIEEEMLDKGGQARQAIVDMNKEIASSGAGLRYLEIKTPIRMDGGTPTTKDIHVSEYLLTDE